MKKIILVLLCCMAFLACENNNNQVTTTAPFIGGKQGLEMKFIDGMPPDFVFDNKGYAFGIGVQVDNLGESDVDADKAYVEIIGINPVDFNKQSQADLKKNLASKITGAKKNSDGTTIAGGRDVIEFSDLNYIGDLHGNAGIKIRAELCYKYDTFTSTKICIKKDLLKNIGNAKICDPNGEKAPSNSGAPVQITSLKEAPMGESKVQISFDIENVKDVKGTIFKRDTVCNDAVNNPDLNKVWVAVKTDINGVKAECSGLMDGADKSEGYVTLFGGEKRTVTCSIDLSNVDSIFEKIYEIDLEYNYFQFVERPLEIRDVST